MATALRVILTALCLFASSAPAAQLRGMVLAGAEFGGANVPGSYGRDYIYPPDSDVNYFTARHATLIRLPFLWERLQHWTRQNLDAVELARLDAVVKTITQSGARVLLDPHNYARYYGHVIGADAYVTAADFADFWSRVAAHYKDNPLVIFGLMNEPHDMMTETWLGDAQAATDAIRATGATNLIAVPGNAWTGAWNWAATYYGTPNAVAMLNYHDPINNSVFEVHQYLDGDGSGSSSYCVSQTIGAERLVPFTGWLRQNAQRAIVGEFAGGDNPQCRAAVSGMLDYMAANQDVLIGWTWWASGPWWGSYMFSLEPTNDATANMQQLVWRYLQP